MNNKGGTFKKTFNILPNTSNFGGSQKIRFKVLTWKSMRIFFLKLNF